MTTISSNEFVHAFCDIWNSQDRRFCFVLGAGASRSSGIRTGGELARLWLGEIQERMKGNEAGYDKFIKDNGIDSNNPGGHYSQIYQERFKLDYPTGFERINKELEHARPGYGYSVLAQILAEKQHNTVITTNFDNLTEDALYTYTQKRPLVCGHESLAMFAQPSVERPLIVKIHRDRFFGPQSLPTDIDAINEAWVKALDSIFDNNIPVFIGYGGNDGSLMGYLEKIKQFKNLFWCERKGVKVSEKVSEFLNKNKGKLVEIDGFDEIMFLLQAKLNLPLLDKRIESIASERATNYRETFEKIQGSQSTSEDKEVQHAAKKIVEEAGDGWWGWELKAQAAKSIDEKDGIYREALNILPNSPELSGNYAVFLKNVKKDFNEAEKYYKKALSLEPNDADYNGNYGNFLKDIREDYEEAEKYYKKALEIDSNHTSTNSNYALFLSSVRENYDEAERYYKKALETNPNHANTIGNYAIFLRRIRNNYDEAEKYYKRALELSPDDADFNGNYALFLKDIRQDYDLAEQYYKKAIDLDPDHVNNIGNYAVFLKSIRQDYNEAEVYFKKALQIDPNHVINSSNYASFLKSIRKNYEEAEKYYKHAFELDSDINSRANYVGILLGQGKRNEGRKMLEAALQGELNEIIKAELQFYCYAHFDDLRDDALQTLKALLCRGIRSKGFNMDVNVQRAVSDGHPDPEMLQRLADILTKDIPVGDLCDP